MGKKQIGTYCVIGLIAAAVCLFLKNADRIASVFSLAFSAAAPLLVVRHRLRAQYPVKKDRAVLVSGHKAEVPHKAQTAGLHPVIIPGPGAYYGRSGVSGGSGAGFQYPAGDR